MAENKKQQDSPDSEWCSRKAMSGNRAESTVHLTRNGHEFLNSTHAYMQRVWRSGEECHLPIVNMMGGPQKCAILEWGLKLVLREFGVSAAELLRCVNQGKPTDDLFRQANEKRESSRKTTGAR